MIVAKLTRVLDKLRNGCSVVVHGNRVLFDDYLLLSIISFCGFRWNYLESCQKNHGHHPG